ncbi:MAG: acyltransferase family protein, partial [Clostridia bacterium]|nr:acyltransferase family protein [Clostridia bacterium]
APGGAATGSALSGAAGGAKKRLLSLDFMRIFAILLVIFNHTNYRGFFHYLSDDPGTFLYWFNLFFSVACKVAVPLFFMISGALLLRKEESIGKTYKRGIRIAVDLVLFSFLFYSVFAWQGGEPLTVMGFLKGVIQKNVWHLWYLYTYLAFLLTVPVLRGFVLALSAKEGFLLFALACVFGSVLPLLEFYIGRVNPLAIPTFTFAMILYYPIMGYLLTWKVDLVKVTWKQLGILWAVNLVFFALCMYTQYRFIGKNPDSLNETFLTNNRFLNAPVVYLTFLKLFDGKSFGEKADKVFTEVGMCTFGIYLIHPLFLTYVPALQKVWSVFEHGGFLRNEFGIVLSVLCVYLMTLAIVWVLRRIPVVKKLF